MVPLNQSSFYPIENMECENEKKIVLFLFSFKIQAKILKSNKKHQVYSVLTKISNFSIAINQEKSVICRNLLGNTQFWKIDALQSFMTKKKC